MSTIGKIFTPANIERGIATIINVIDTVGGVVRKVWPLLEAFGGGLWDGIKTAVTPLIPLFSSLFSGSEGPSQTLIGAMRTIGQVLGLVGTVLAATTGAFFGLLAAGNLAVGWLVGTLAGLGTKLWGLGSDIVAGLWEGIKAGWGNMLAGFSALVDLLPAAVKSALGIHSPSRVFAELGMYTAAGFTEGVEGGTGEAQAAVVAMVDPRVATGLRSLGGGGGGMSQSVGSITFNVAIEGERDPAATVEKFRETAADLMASLFDTTAIEMGAVGAPA